MIRFLVRHRPNRFHLSEDILTRVIFEELSPARRFLARVHLRRCRHCKSRHELRERTALLIVQHRQNLATRLGRLSPARRDRFIRELDLKLESVSGKSRWKQSVLQFGIRPFGSALPSVKSALVLICAGFILFSLWRWRLPVVSATEFFDRAVASDSSPAKIAGSGVICRRYRIKTARRTIEHAVYRDTSGGRQPKYAKLGAEEVHLAARLALAGVNWDDPLSAISFKNWHDRQPNPKDEVHSSSDGLLTISTRLPSASIAQETLTVRKDGFHPVERTVEYREFDRVDISEVSLELLSWDTANQLFFELHPANRSAVRPAPVPAPLPNTAEMDETELEARLKLNQVSADTGEQIEITRDVNGVQVQGLVESKERKQVLEESLQGIPFLSLKIKSFEDLESTPGPGAQVAAPQLYAVVKQVSPLEQYFAQQGRSRDDLTRISVGLFNSSVAINRSSRSIQQILLRFSANEGLSAGAIHARDELLRRNVARVLQDLKEQETLLREAAITFESQTGVPGSSDADSPDFVRLADRNTAAVRELISHAREPGRSEQQMAAELAETISELRSAALALGRKVQR